jgi:hypothetical protein
MKKNNMLVGADAIGAARKGARLYVRSFAGLVPASPGAIERAERMEPHALWIYVAHAILPRTRGPRH